MAFTPAALSLRGGLNLADSDSDMKPGECRELVNYEINTSGRYQRVTGFERFDGRPSPSAVRVVDLAGFPFETDEAALAALNAEVETRRALITAVPGSGPVIGVFMFAGIVYAMRNTSDGNAAKLYRATSTGWAEVTTPALLPNGRLFTRQTNFSGSSGTLEIIGVDGKNKAFRFNGTTFTQITGPITPDAPITLEVLPSQTLLLGYRGGSFVFSAVGDPTKFSSVDGGGEIAVADEITDMQVQADNTCAIGCRNRLYMLYGSSKTDFQLKSLSTKVGMRTATAQSLSDTLFLDDRGLTMLARVQQFGDFAQATISQKVQPLLDQYAGRDMCSVTIKTKNQYRLFFTDGSALFITLAPDGAPQFTQVNYGVPIRCAFSGEDAFGIESVFVGAENGFVYQLDKGFSFDGLEYESYLLTGFMHFGSPETKKKWHKLVIECDSVTEVLMHAIAYFDFMSPDTPDSELIVGSGSKWDLSEWDNATWGNGSTNWADMYIAGVSRNIALHLSNTSKQLPPHIISNLYLHSKPVSRRR
ncbi:hypothetical protein [Shewanella cutis]|uniref:Uncharacterized protein n=1 Tax=Shewanella cutis TaxID=2766780 RepID=A0ABS9QYX8_9GAMM|nr:hypothetical protein [Shewanella sp. PS-2]MCG9964621.1 hypothetical protein [Shewanella sp. PS-2]